MEETVNHSTLHGLIQSIISNFRSLATNVLQTEQSALGLAAARLENENQRFDLWCRNLGAYRSGHASLEYRLRDAPKIYDYAMRLLRDLNGNTGLGQSHVWILVKHMAMMRNI